MTAPLFQALAMYLTRQTRCPSRMQWNSLKISKRRSFRGLDHGSDCTSAHQNPSLEKALWGCSVTVCKSSQSSLAYEVFPLQVDCWKLWMQLAQDNLSALKSSFSSACLCSSSGAWVWDKERSALTQNSAVNILTLVGCRAWDVYFISLSFHTQLDSQRREGGEVAHTD